MDLFREIKTARFTVLLHLFVSYLCNNPTNSGAVALTHGTVDAILASNELVFINFYADWCRFSNLLTPIFNEAAEKVSLEFPNPGQVVMGKVDCDKESDVASRFHITKYPTLKVIRNGQPAKREYRGARTVDAFVEFVKKQLEDPIKEFLDLGELKNLDSKKRIIIGFFERKDVPEYTTFRRVATNLKDDCQFHVGFGDVVKSELMDGTLAKIAYRPDETSFQEVEVYKGHILNYTEMLMWATRCCIPLVREITFENAEELTEEGLPLLILFHKPDDKTSVRVYKAACEEIKAERIISRVWLSIGKSAFLGQGLGYEGVAGNNGLGFDGVAVDSKTVQQMHPPAQPIVVFRPDVALSNERDETFTGSLLSYDETNVWISEKCVPLVREITFENAEELTEEGLPFLILFHKPDDTDTVKRFKDICQNLAAEKQNINFLTADGARFAHPLHHLGKSQDDLPLIAIDSFRHMYLYPDIKDMDTPGSLQNFIKDLYSGKLHREFHYGPDNNEVHNHLHIEGKVGKVPSTTPPESTFKKLGPSKNRYTLLRDEL